MDEEMIWKMQLRRVEHSIRELCRKAITAERPDRLAEANLMLHTIEREIIDHFQEHERGEIARKGFHPLLRPLMTRIEGDLCNLGFFWEWEASKIRTRLRSE